MVVFLRDLGVSEKQHEELTGRISGSVVTSYIPHLYIDGCHIRQPSVLLLCFFQFFLIFIISISCNSQ